MKPTVSSYEELAVVKEYKFGNSTVIVHSELWCMSDEELDIWVKEETEKGNVTLERIREAARKCYMDDE
jgi:hypothetical protein